MNIAVVDDCHEDRELLAAKIELYMKNMGFSYQFHAFESGEQFLHALEKAPFDIVFMDIYMEGITGMETALHLRQIDSDCKLVILTSSEEYFRQGYSVNACHYLVKPANHEDFLQAMANCHIRRQVDVPVLDVISDKVLLHIDTTQIIYMDICQRNTIIHTECSTITAAGSFKLVTQPLAADKRFLLCIQGVLVNMDYIQRIEDSVFLLKNGERMPIALRNKKQLIQLYRNYLFDTMRGV